MVIVAGLERMTFEVLRTLSEEGAAIHCIINSWENFRIVPLVESVGASWTTGYYWYRFDRHTRNPLQWFRFGWDIFWTSVGLLRDARRFRATHILIPDHLTALRNAPALLLLRFTGRRVIFRVGNHPPPTRFYSRLWRSVLPRLVDLFVANSDFSRRRIVAAGVPEERTSVIKNTPSRRRSESNRVEEELISWMRTRPTLICVGQLAPFKGNAIFVQSVLELIASGADVQGLIVGRIPDWPPEYVHYVESMRATIAAAGAENRIRFTGEVEDVPSVMQQAYLLAAPILQEETFGNVVLEALAEGLPVVVFPTGGLPELVVDGVTGSITEEMTGESLTQSMRELLDDRQKRDAAAAATREWFEKSEYTPERFRTAWMELFCRSGSAS